MSAAAPSTNAQQPNPVRTFILPGLGFLAAAVFSLTVEAVARKGVSDHGPMAMQVVYWLLFGALTLLGAVLVLVNSLWFLLTEALPWWLRRYDPEQWQMWQDKLAARGGPASRWHLFTFGCYLIGGLAMLLPVARMLFWP